MRIRSIAVGVSAVLCALASATPCRAQDPVQDPGRIASRLLKLDSWTYEAIEGLHTRGYLPGLNALVQPYRRLDVALRLQAIDTTGLREPVATWVRRMRAELAPELAHLAGDAPEGERIGAEVVFGGRAADSRRLDPLFTFRESPDRTTDAPRYTYNGFGLWLELSNLVAEGRAYDDRWYRGKGGDPDGHGPGGFHFLGRSDYAYVTLAYPWGKLLVGRIARNWAPLGQGGLMLGANATTYPQIGVDLGRGRVTFSFMAGELEPLADRKRYLVANRIDYTTPRFQASLAEAALYSGHGSTLRLINPLEILFLDHNANNDRPDITGNLMLDAMFWARVGRGSVSGEFMLDDFDLNPRIGNSEGPIEATSYGMHVRARHPGPSEAVAFGLDYRRVAGWTYRTLNNTEGWTYLDRGLGDAFSDYDRVTATVDVFPNVPGLRLSPVLQLQRKGESDLRQQLPPGPELNGAPGMFHGVVERTRRVAIQGRYQPISAVILDWDVGRSSISNAGHVSGVSEGRFTYLARLGFSFAWSGEFGGAD